LERKVNELIENEQNLLIERNMLESTDPELAELLKDI